MSIKDLLFQLTELKNENDNLKEQVSFYVKQQNWFMKQIDGYQQEYGACYHQYSLCCLELYNLKQYLHSQGEPQSSLVQVPPPQSSLPLEQVQAVDTNHPKHQELHGMMQQDIESHSRERAEAIIFQKTQSQIFQNQQADQTTLLMHYKVQLELSHQKYTALEAEMQSVTNKVNQEKSQISAVRKKLKECQADCDAKDSQIKNQKETIHRLQNNTISLTEKLAINESLLKEANKEVSIATDLFNEMSVKCTRMKADHSNVLREMNQTMISLRATNTKMVQKAVEQAKIIKQLNSSVKMTFQVDKATTEEVMREGYNDLQKFLEQKTLQMEHILALVAYAITHLKFVLERFVEERMSESKVSVACDFLNQVIHHLTRVFLIIPLPVMLRNIDRLTDIAVEQCISMKALHLIQYQLPQTAEDAQASRQRVILENFPQLSEFFTRPSTTDDDTVCMSVNGFMMLIGISK